MTIAVALAGHISRDFAIDIACELPAQGVTAVLGPSGSGKTSLLRALAGLDHVPGTVRFGEEIWQDATRFVPAHKRRIGYVFQGAGLLPHLSVRGNLSFAARRASGGRSGFDDIVDRTGIADLLDRMPDRLSGGEAQRAAIARALASRPRLLLMDEPLSALDADARAGLAAQLADILGAIGVPVLYVTHDLGEARRLASRTLRMRKGALEKLEEVAP
jgi:molybdate transport system ATP-binding protein